MMIWTSNQGWLSYCTDPDYPHFRQQAPTLLVNMNPSYCQDTASVIQVRYVTPPLTLRRDRGGGI